MSLHADALAVLSAWEPPTSEQADLREDYVSLLHARSDAMTRECLPDHLTASAFVFDESHTHVLLTLHAKAQRWFQFGGHPESGDERLADAALREAVEESGLSSGDLTIDPVPVALDAHRVPFCGDGGRTRHFDVMYAAVARDGVRHSVSEESLDVAWWPVDDLPNPELGPRIALALARQSTSESGGS